MGRKVKISDEVMSHCLGVVGADEWVTQCIDTREVSVGGGSGIKWVMFGTREERIFEPVARYEEIKKETRAKWYKAANLRPIAQKKVSK